MAALTRGGLLLTMIALAACARQEVVSPHTRALCELGTAPHASAAEAGALAEEAQARLERLSGQPSTERDFRIFRIVQILVTEAKVESAARPLSSQGFGPEARRRMVAEAVGDEVAAAVGSVATAQAELRRACGAR